MINKRQGWTKAFQPTQHAPVTFVTFNVTADVMLVRAVLRANNLLLYNPETKKIFHDG